MTIEHYHKTQVAYIDNWRGLTLPCDFLGLTLWIALCLANFLRYSLDAFRKALVCTSLTDLMSSRTIWKSQYGTSGIRTTGNSSMKASNLNTRYRRAWQIYLWKFNRYACFPLYAMNSEHYATSRNRTRLTAAVLDCDSISATLENYCPIGGPLQIH